MDFTYRETECGHLYHIARTAPPFYKYYSCIVDECPGRVSIYHNEAKKVTKKQVLDVHNHGADKIPLVLLNERKFKTLIVRMASDESLDHLTPTGIINRAMETIDQFVFNKKHGKSYRKTILNKRYRRVSNGDTIVNHSRYEIKNYF